MSEQHHIWRIWARHLQNWGVKGFAAWLLEATAPVHLIGAQLVYISQPLLGVFITQDHVRSVASVLERPDETRALVHFLLEEPSP